MGQFQKWEGMLTSVATSPEVWEVYGEMKQTIEQQQEALEKEKYYHALTNISLIHKIEETSALYDRITKLNREIKQLKNDSNRGRDGV